MQATPYSQERFDRLIIEQGVITLAATPITLKSGRTSHLYVNWRTLTGDAYLLDQLTDFIAAYVCSTLGPMDTIYGVPEGATKAAVVATLKLARCSQRFAPGSHTVAMGRGKPKEHGAAADRYVLGTPKGRTLVLEDVTTTGNSLIEAIDRLHDSGIEVAAALSLTQRDERRDDGSTVEEYIQQRYDGDVAFHAMSHADTLLLQAINNLQPPPPAELIEALRREMAAKSGRPPQF